MELKKNNSHRFQLPEKWLLPSPLISFCTLLALSWSTNDKGLLFFKCIMITPPLECLLTVSSTWNANFYPNHLMWLYASLWFSILFTCIVFKSWPKNSPNNVFFNAFFSPSISWSRGLAILLIILTRQLLVLLIISVAFGFNISFFLLNFKLSLFLIHDG